MLVPPPPPPLPPQRPAAPGQLRDNRHHAGARAQIVNAAFQILEPWSTKSNLSTRIKTLYEKTDDFKVAMEEQLQAKREAFLQDVHASLQRSEWRSKNCASLCPLHFLSTCAQQEAKRGPRAGCACHVPEESLSA